MEKQVRILALSFPSYVTPVYLRLSEPQVFQLSQDYKSWCYKSCVPYQLRVRTMSYVSISGSTMGSRRILLTPQNQEARWLSQGIPRMVPRVGLMPSMSRGMIKTPGSSPNSPVASEACGSWAGSGHHSANLGCGIEKDKTLLPCGIDPEQKL